ncbi:MAG: hypothetical protein KJ955_07840 [Nanoarchaeota archaeon]|nr:hypothetical protein [Nanoarchaeota archaeon]
MGLVQIKFRASDVFKVDLESTLILNNQSSRYSDGIVAQDLRNFLEAYCISVRNPSGEPLHGACADCQDWRGNKHVRTRSTSIRPPTNGHIYRVEARQGAARDVCEAYHFSFVNDAEARFVSENGEYYVYIRPDLRGVVSQ